MKSILLYLNFYNPVQFPATAKPTAKFTGSVRSLEKLLTFSSNSILYLHNSKILSESIIQRKLFDKKVKQKEK